MAVLFQACHVRSLTRLDEENRILKHLLNSETNNPGIRPSVNGSAQPVTVTYNMYIRSIDNLDELNMECSVQVTFRQQWNDERLRFRNPSSIQYLTLADPSRIWTSDAFFSNEKNGHFHNIVKPNTLLRIYPNGDVLYSVRLSLTLRCPMDLRYYPMDRQIVSLIVASYGYTTEDVIYLWKIGDPVQVSKNLNLSKFTLEKFSTDYCTSRTNTGEYSCLKLDLKFRREFTTYFIDIYLPTIILVMLSWLCFALDHKDTTTRVVLFASVFVVFSMKLMCLNAKLPSPNYQTAYSTWVTTCFLFLTAVIAKIGYDAFLVRRNQRRDDLGMSSDENDLLKNKSSFSEELPANTNVILRVYHRLIRRYPSTQQKTDVVCLIGFPLAFALFNVFYWSLNVHHDQ